MARGFYDLAIAAPSKAALEAWGTGGNPSHQGVAKEGDDPNVVAATMSRPSVVFKPPAGSNRPFAEHSDLPSDLGIQRERDSAEKGVAPKSAKRCAPEISERDARKPAADFEKEQRRRDAERRGEEAARQRGAATAREADGQSASCTGQGRARAREEGRGHPDEAEALEKRSRAEDDRLDKVRERLHAARGRARD